jgi:hypothetical protein
VYNNIPQVSRTCMRQTPHKVVDVGVGGERTRGGVRAVVSAALCVEPSAQVVTLREQFRVVLATPRE